jgi:hypothetical protein
MSERNDFETILKWVVIAVLALVAFKVATMALGIAFVLGTLLLFRVLPLVLLVWGIWKVVEWLGRGEGNGARAGGGF